MRVGVGDRRAARSTSPTCAMFQSMRSSTRAHFVARLPDRLAHLARRELRALLRFLLEQVAERAAARAARSAYGRAAHAGCARAGPRDLLRDLARFGDRDRADELAGRGLRTSSECGCAARLAARARRRPRSSVAPASASTGRRDRRADAARRRGAEVDRRERAASSAIPSGPGRRSSCRTKPLLGEARQRLLDVVERTERVPAFGALLQLARRLRAAQQQHAEQRRLGHGEVERLVDDVAVLHDPLTGGLHPARTAPSRAARRARARPSSRRSATIGSRFVDWLHAVTPRSPTADSCRAS